MDKDTIVSSGNLNIRFDLGNNSQPFQNVLGLGFEMSYDPLIVDSNSISLQPINSWLFNSATSYLTASNYLKQSGRIIYGIVRNDHHSKSGFGQIANLKIKLNSNKLPPSAHPYPFQLFVNKFVIVDSIGRLIPCNLSLDSLALVYFSSNRIELPKHRIELSPNPGSNEIKFNGGFTSETIVDILDIQGRTIKKYLVSPISGIIKIDLEGIEPGCYFLKVTDSNRNISFAKFVKE